MSTCSILIHWCTSESCGLIKIKGAPTARKRCHPEVIAFTRRPWKAERILAVKLCKPFQLCGWDWTFTTGDVVDRSIKQRVDFGIPWKCCQLELDYDNLWFISECFLNVLCEKALRHDHQWDDLRPSWNLVKPPFAVTVAHFCEEWWAILEAEDALVDFVANRQVWYITAKAKDASLFGFCLVSYLWSMSMTPELVAEHCLTLYSGHIGSQVQTNPIFATFTKVVLLGPPFMDKPYNGRSTSITHPVYLT